jgi:hypothetical protein
MCEDGEEGKKECRNERPERKNRKLFNTEKFVSTNITGDLVSHFVLRMGKN